MNARIYKATGFTLIELSVAVVVAALLFAWAIPGFQRFLNRATLNSETNNWVAVLNLARNEADYPRRKSDDMPRRRRSRRL